MCKMPVSDVSLSQHGWGVYKVTILPRKLTWNLKITPLKRIFVFQTSILGLQLLVFGGGGGVWHDFSERKRTLAFTVRSIGPSLLFQSHCLRKSGSTVQRRKPFLGGGFNLKKSFYPYLGFHDPIWRFAYFSNGYGLVQTPPKKLGVSALIEDEKVDAVGMTPKKIDMFWWWSLPKWKWRAHFFFGLHFKLFWSWRVHSFRVSNHFWWNAIAISVYSIGGTGGH